MRSSPDEALDGARQHGCRIKHDRCSDKSSGQHKLRARAARRESSRQNPAQAAVQPRLVYEPDADFYGADEITVEATDADGANAAFGRC